MHRPMHPATRNRPTRALILPAAVLSLLSLLAALPAGAEVPVPELDWDTPLGHFQMDSEKFVGQRLAATCPAAGPRTEMPAIRGTDVYPSDSALCVAALHAGEIGRDGGAIVAQLMPGGVEYTGSERHGVASGSLPPTDRSIVFVGAVESPAAAQVRREWAPRLDWDAKFTRTGLANRELHGQTFVFQCPAAPADLTPRIVHGTDVYAFDSIVCRAAVHAGSIGLDGGLVEVTLQPGVPQLVGSIRNGIETRNGPGGHTTLVFGD